jgi:uncharacterized SAM-binding protein YcdF (DUF218 family)
MLSALTISVSVLVGGFLVFLAEFERAAIPLFDQADGIVVLTGGPDRIAEAASLMAAGKARELLISGVNEFATADDMIRIAPSLGPIMACCVTLGRTATNTRGNALETAAWITDRHLGTVIVVTSHAHMPRALFELKQQRPDLPFSPHRVGGPAGGRIWWFDLAVLRPLAIEYIKMTGAIFRGAIESVVAQTGHLVYGSAYDERALTQRPE